MVRESESAPFSFRIGAWTLYGLLGTVVILDTNQEDPWMGLFHRKLRMTPQELGLGLFHGTIFDRSPHLGSIKHATGRFPGCQGLELQEERVRRELLLLALAVVDMQLSHAMNHGTLRPSDSSDVLTTYMGALCTFELKIPETELYELMRDRLPVYYKALNDWLSSTDSQQRQAIGPVERPSRLIAEFRNPSNTKDLHHCAEWKLHVRPMSLLLFSEG